MTRDCRQLHVSFASRIGKLAAPKSSWVPVLWASGFVLGLGLTINLFVLSFIAREQCIYFWDFSGHWNVWIESVRNLEQSPKGIIMGMWRSINGSMYNYTPGILTAPLGFWFGTDRVVYLLSFLNLHILPMCVLLLLLGRRLFLPMRHRRAFFIAFAVTVFFYPPLYTPLFRNYYCVVGLVPMLVILWLTLKHQFLERDIPRSIALGLLLLGLVILRRWYVYWVVGLVVAMTLINLVTIAFASRRSWRPAWNYGVNMAVAGAVCVGVAVLLFPGFLRQSFGENWHDLYIAYAPQSRIGELYRTMLRLGPVHLALAGAGAAVVIRRGGGAGAFLAKLCMLTSGFAALYFVKDSTIGVHHRLIFTVTILICIGFSLGAVFDNVRSRIVAWGVVVGLMAVIAINWMVVFSPLTVSKMPKALLGIFSAERCEPWVRNDLPRIRALVDDLKTLAAASPGDNRIYVVSSSLALNGDALRRLDFPRIINALPELLGEGGVDNREGFPNQLFVARYVVVGEPVQCHLAPRFQRTVSVLTEGMLDTNRFGGHYRRLRSYMLEGGVQAHIYERQGPYSRESIDFLDHYFAEAYPGNELLSVNRVAPLITALHWGLEGGEIRCVGNRSLFLHPGRTEATSATLGVWKGAKRFTFTETFDNLKTLLQRGDDNAEVNVRIEVDGKFVRSDYITARTPLDVDVDVEGATTLQVTVDSGKHGPNGDWFLLKDVNIH